MKKTISFLTQSPTKDADFFSGHHIYANRECRWQGNRPQDWSLILTLGGRGEISTKHGALKNTTGDLCLISPNHPHTFYTASDWKIRWVHFLLRAHMPSEINWPQPVRGLFQTRLEDTDLKECTETLEEINALDFQRTKGWHGLAYNLVENILLRISNKVSKCESTADPKILLAQKLLLQSHENPIGVDEVAAKCGMSRSSFYLHFKQTVGISPREYREIHALRRAQRLIEESHLSLSEISEQIGMPNIYYFSSRFKKFSGLPPSQWRRNYM